jgi:hypothetical protein
MYIQNVPVSHYLLPVPFMRGPALPLSGGSLIEAETGAWRKTEETAARQGTARTMW